MKISSIVNLPKNYNAFSRYKIHPEKSAESINFMGRDKFNFLQETIKKHPIKACAACFLASLSILAAAEFNPPTPSVATLEVDPRWFNLKSLSCEYGIPEFAIMQYNNIESADDLYELETVKIPSKYDYIQPQIDKWEEKLYKNRGDHKKVFNYGLDLIQMRKKQDIQKETGYMYTDGKFVYIYVDIKSEIPDFTQDEKISAKDFIALFDIEEGETLLKYNNIKKDKSAASNNHTLEGYYLENGDLVKVPASEVMKNSIYSYLNYGPWA